jgi:hypothetical protein
MIKRIGSRQVGSFSILAAVQQRKFYRDGERANFGLVVSHDGFTRQ